MKTAGSGVQNMSAVELLGVIQTRFNENCGQLMEKFKEEESKRLSSFSQIIYPISYIHVFDDTTIPLYYCLADKIMFENGFTFRHKDRIWRQTKGTIGKNGIVWGGMRELIYNSITPHPKKGATKLKWNLNSFSKPN